MSFQELIEREKEQRRQFILDIAEDLFIAKGFSSVSMDEIAKNVGLNRTTLYLYFKDKDSLFFAIVLRKVSLVDRMYQECLKQKGTGRDRVRNMGVIGWTFAQENTEFFNMVYTAWPERIKNTDNPLAKELIERSLSELYTMRDLLKEGIADGSVRDDLDPQEMACFILQIFRSIMCPDPVWRKYLETKGFDYPKYVGDFFRFIEHTIDNPKDIREKPPVKKKQPGTHLRKRQ